MTAPHELDRYHRQMLLPGIGEAGQRRLGETRALVVGCGALGTVIVDQLARAGIGALTIIDRDLVELTNLQRQVLFEERDVDEGMPKAEAARRRVARINRHVDVHAIVDDFSHANAERLAADADLIMDGLDNFETRYVLNDLGVKRGLPYLYGGAVGTTGMSLTILPHAERRAGPATSRITWSDDQATPCLRCVFPEAPPPGTSPTCDTAGVLGPVVSMVASHQVVQAIKLVTGNVAHVDRRLLSLDAWTGQWMHLDVSNARDGGDCPCCVEGRFEFLEGRSVSMTTSLCGRNAIQITPGSGEAGGPRFDLAVLAARLAPHGAFTSNEHLIRGTFAAERGREGSPIELTVFPNGRAIIKGTTEPEVARGLYAKYVGV